MDESRASRLIRLPAAEARAARISAPRLLAQGLRVAAAAGLGIDAFVHATSAALYDGPAGGFAVRLRPKNGGASVVLHLSFQNTVAGVDNAVLAIADAMDFSTVPHESSFTKDLFFDAKIYPALGKLDGEYLVSTVYSSTFDGAGLDVGSPVWTGTLISEEATITFIGEQPTKEPPKEIEHKVRD